MPRAPARVAAKLVAAVAAIGVLFSGMPASMPASAAGAARLYVSPASGTFAPGGTVFEVQVRVSTGPSAVNAVEAFLWYPASLLDVLQVDSITGSMLEFRMPDVAVDPVAGSVHVTGGLASGFSGGFLGDGLVATIRFRTRTATGTASLLVDAGRSHVLRSADNTDVLGSVGGGLYTIGTPPPPPPVCDVRSGTLRLTGRMEAFGPSVRAEYELLYGGYRVVLGITMSYEGRTPVAVQADASAGTIWFDVERQAGRYDFVMRMWGGCLTYAARMAWDPSAAELIQGAEWQAQGDRWFVPYSCALDLSHASAVCAWDRNGANPQGLAVPDGHDLLVSIAWPAGSYRVVIVAGQTVTFGALTHPRTGDLNHDGIINLYDASAMVPAWGPCGADQEADLNFDSVVDILDASMARVPIVHWSRLP
jgi:hypothetical protein